MHDGHGRAPRSEILADETVRRERINIRQYIACPCNFGDRHGSSRQYNEGCACTDRDVTTARFEPIDMERPDIDVRVFVRTSGLSPMEYEAVYVSYDPFKVSAVKMTRAIRNVPFESSTLHRASHTSRQLPGIGEFAEPFCRPGVRT